MSTTDDERDHLVAQLREMLREKRRLQAELADIDALLAVGLDQLRDMEP